MNRTLFLQSQNYKNLLLNTFQAWRNVLRLENGDGNPLQCSYLGNSMDRGSLAGALGGHKFAESDTTE